MASPLDLDAYLARIDWRGALTPSLETLAGLLDAHMARIPFENLDVLLGRPIALDLASLEAKLVRGRRGGYCFEHATLFAAVLERLGFRPVTHSARVTLFTSRSQSPRTHMLLTVPLPEGTFLVDPGFGGRAPRVPIPVVIGGSSAGRHTFAPSGSEWILRDSADGQTVDLWTSTLEPDLPVDFEVANHYIATHPRSPFVNMMMLRAFTGDGSVAILNRMVTLRRGGEVHTRPLADRAELRRLLTDVFGLDLPEVEQLHVPTIPEWE